MIFLLHDAHVFGGLEVGNGNDCEQLVLFGIHYIGGAAKLDNFGADLCCWTSSTLSL
jgi:hypothetical protein